MDNKIKQKLARFTLLGSRVDPRVEKSRPDPTRRFWSIDPTRGRVGSGKPESGRPVYQYGDNNNPKYILIPMQKIRSIRENFCDGQYKLNKMLYKNQKEEQRRIYTYV